MGTRARLATGIRGNRPDFPRERVWPPRGNFLLLSVSFRPTMKKSLLLISALGASLLTGGYLLGQASASNSITAPAAASKPQRLVRVSTLKTIEANQEFQNNVQIMQAMRQQVIEATTAMEKETNASKKKELKAKADELLARLNENNQKMLKAYGFTLERSYTVVAEVAHIYMVVTDEEAARFEKATAPAPAKK